MTANAPADIRPTGMQSMMSYWERLHPVNAVQIAEVSRPITSQELSSAVLRLFEKFRAADPWGRWPSATRVRARSGGEVSCEVRVLSLSDSHPLEGLVTDLLNRPFADEEPPFRVGLAENSEAQYLWLCYRHSIADARSITLLMQNLLEELCWTGVESLPLAIERSAQPLSALFPAEYRQTARLRLVGHSLKTLWSLRSCHRRPPADPEEFRMSFQVHAERLPLAALQEQAKDWEVTIGELLLAAMLDWFIRADRSTPYPRKSPNRCVSVLADLAGRAEPKRPRLFGQYLSPLNIMVNSQRTNSFSDVIRNMQATTRPAHGIADSLRSLRGLSVNSFLVSRCPRAFANWYQELLFPVSGALSNVNLHSVLPPPRTSLPLTNYFRGTCATQFAPMILCLTTFQDTCTLTTTHRDTVYSADEIREMARHVIRRAFGSVEEQPLKVPTSFDDGMPDLVQRTATEFGNNSLTQQTVASPGC